MKRLDNGLFITIEGGEGSGKSTLIEKLFSYFSHEKSRLVLKTLEPGGTPFGQEIRKILLEKKGLIIGNKAELLLFLADRAHHVETLIQPALSQDMVVICDRFTDSSIAYQGIARKLDREMNRLKDLCLYAADDLVPDITFYLDIDPSKAFERLKRDKDRLESEHIDFHKAVREGYHALAKQEKNRIIVLDATVPPEEVFQEAVKHLEKAVRI